MTTKRTKSVRLCPSLSLSKCLLFNSAAATERKEWAEEKQEVQKKKSLSLSLSSPTSLFIHRRSPIFFLLKSHPLVVGALARRQVPPEAVGLFDHVEGELLRLDLVVVAVGLLF